jgi:Fe/S biogenesis protein NfuA
MIQIHPGAESYFHHLIKQQDAGDLGLRIVVESPGTPAADCQLTFCEPDQVPEGDLKIACAGFDLYVDKDSISWLSDAELDFEQDQTGGQLIVKAPNIRGSEPAADAPLKERAQYLMDSEINPSVASHGGTVTLVDIDDQGVAILQFGGGCQGCGMANVTLKEGIEKTLMRELPELTGVRDVTDHQSGDNPYYA